MHKKMMQISEAPSVLRLVAGNPGPMTGPGTNSYIIGRHELFILDPGPVLEAHLCQLTRLCAGRRVRGVLVTHSHRDHTAAARRLADELDAPLLGPPPHSFYRPLAEGEVHGLEQGTDWDYRPDRALAAGESLKADDARLEVVATPGHTRNHLSYRLGGHLFTGDHVMGWSSSIVAPPDGHMGDYLASLERIMALDASLYLPGHGATIGNGPARARALLDHRRTREAEILQTLRRAGSAVDTDTVAASVYAGLPPAARPAARLSTQAHLEHLAEQGLATQLDTHRFRAA